jgi:hypothetical protein
MNVFPTASLKKGAMYLDKALHMPFTPDSESPLDA